MRFKGLVIEKDAAYSIACCVGICNPCANKPFETSFAQLHQLLEEADRQMRNDVLFNT
jgi:hypothetical protein